MTDYVVSWMQNGDFRSVRDFIQTLQSINQYVYEDEENCLTLLHLAVGLDSIHREQIIEILLECRADLNCVGRSENVEDIRPLHMAAMWGYDMTVKLLLYEGADVSLRDSNGLTAIDYASTFDNHVCVSLLLCYGSLNSTATAWATIMNSSSGDNLSVSSMESYLNGALALDAFNDTTIDYRPSAINYYRK